MAERGVTHPSPKVVDGVRTLVAALRGLSPDDDVAIDATKSWAIFRRRADGELIARIDFE